MMNTIHIQTAIAQLRLARDNLSNAGALRAAEKVRRALKSAEGALRNAEGHENRERRWNGTGTLIPDDRTEAERMRDADIAHFAKTLD